MIKTLIVDDHPMVAKGLKQTLEFSDSIKVCAIADSAASCIEFFNLYKPQVVLLDIKLPDGNGMDLSKQLFKLNPELKIVALTSFNQRYYIKAMVQNGVQGYLLKSAQPETIIEAIIQVFEGENYFCDEVKKVLAEKEPTLYLSKRELEVLSLIAIGLTNQEISEKLFISPLTADSHRKNLILKLGAKNTASLISIASNEGYL